MSPFDDITCIVDEHIDGDMIVHEALGKLIDA